MKMIQKSTHISLDDLLAEMVKAVFPISPAMHSKFPMPFYDLLGTLDVMEHLKETLDELVGEEENEDEEDGGGVGVPEFSLVEEDEEEEEGGGDGAGRDEVVVGVGGRFI